MATHDFRDLKVWQRSIAYVTAVYKVAAQLPKTETYALSDQLRRAVVSVPSNIAEGQKRLNHKEIIQFSGMALGSLAEVQTQLIIVKNIYAINTDSLIDEADEIGRMLTALIKALKSKL
jgi:four helix bundle protein